MESASLTTKERWNYRYISLAARFSGLTVLVERSTIHVLVKGGPAPSPAYCVTRYLFFLISLASYFHFIFGNDLVFSSIILFSTNPAGVGWFFTNPTA